MAKTSYELLAPVLLHLKLFASSSDYFYVSVDVPIAIENNLWNITCCLESDVIRQTDGNN